MGIRAPRLEELDALTELCVRSKATWGYDDAFMNACRDELKITAEHLNRDHCAVFEADGETLGFAQVTCSKQGTFIDKLFIRPDVQGQGVGKKLFDWCVKTARSEDATTLDIHADPGAVPFSQKMGATQIGSVPSGSIPGRFLPHLAVILR